MGRREEENGFQWWLVQHSPSFTFLICYIAPDINAPQSPLWPLILPVSGRATSLYTPPHAPPLVLCSWPTERNRLKHRWRYLPRLHHRFQVLLLRLLKLQHMVLQTHKPLNGKAAMKLKAPTHCKGRRRPTTTSKHRHSHKLLRQPLH